MKDVLNYKVNAIDARNFLIRIMGSKLTGYLKGSPGTGKSELIASIARDYNLLLVDVRLAQCDPTELAGFPKLNATKDRAGYAPMEHFPIEGDTIPNNPDGVPYAGWLLLLDELNHADRSVQKAAYKLILDRMVGDNNLHKKVRIIAAGNLATDNALVEEMGTAMQSRLIHLELKVELEAWVDWAIKNKVNSKIIAYLNFRPQMLFNFIPDHNEHSYPAPRTWKFLDSLIKGHPSKDVQESDTPLYAGTIGAGAAREFINFCEVYKNLITVEEILRNPTGAAVPNDLSILYALTGTIGEKINLQNSLDLGLYIDRMPIEFQVLAYREAMQHNPTNKNLPSYGKWLRENADALYIEGV